MLDAHTDNTFLVSDTKLFVDFHSSGADSRLRVDFNTFVADTRTLVTRLLIDFHTLVNVVETRLFDFHTSVADTILSIDFHTSVADT